MQWQILIIIYVLYCLILLAEVCEGITKILRVIN